MFERIACSIALAIALTIGVMLMVQSATRAMIAMETRHIAACGGAIC